MVEDTPVINRVCLRAKYAIIPLMLPINTQINSVTPITDVSFNPLCNNSKDTKVHNEAIPYCDRSKLPTA